MVVNEQVFTPLELEPIIGWKGWKVGIGKKAFLYSCNGYLWIPGKPNLAGCRITPHLKFHQTPDEWCYCGIYATNNSPRVDQRIQGLVAGKVALWGRVIEGESGYRASHAYPLTLEYVVCGNCWEWLPVGNTTEIHKELVKQNHRPKVRPGVIHKISERYNIKIIESKSSHIDFDLPVKSWYTISDLNGIFGVSEEEILKITQINYPKRWGNNEGLYWITERYCFFRGGEGLKSLVMMLWNLSPSLNTGDSPISLAIIMEALCGYR